MLILKDVVSCRKCEIDIDYYVPFTINIENEEKYKKKVYWRTGNLKKSLIEIAIDESSGILRDITLTSVDKAYLLNTEIKDIEEVTSGIPVFLIDTNINNGLCDHLMDIYVYLGVEFVMVNFGEKIYPFQFIEFDRVRMGFDVDNRLVTIIIMDLSSYEYNELKESFRL